MVRIVQISDLHAKDGKPTLGYLERALDFMRPLKPAAIILSGDIASKPHEHNYKLAREALAKAPAPVLMIPGNSDNHVLLRQAFADNDYWPCAGAFSFSRIVGDGVRIIGFDVSVPGEKHGFATEEGLSWLAGELAMGSGLPTLLMMHQNPFPIGIGDLDANMLRNAEAFWDVVEQALDKPAAVVCGHGHRTIFTSMRGIPTIMCPSLKKAVPVWLEGADEPEVTDPPGLIVHDFSGLGLRSYVVSLGA